MGNNPWNNNGGNSGGQKPPQKNPLEDMLKKARRSNKPIKPNKGIIIGVFAILLLGWLATGIYEIDTGEQGVVMRFGAYERITPSGLHYKLPMPFEKVHKVAVEKINTVNIGGVDDDGKQRSNRRNKKSRTYYNTQQNESMLTAKRNIVIVPFSVNWKVKDAASYLFNVRDPYNTVRSAAESAMREVVAQTTFSDVLAEGKQEVARKAREILQNILDDYNSGIDITQLNMTDVQPPKGVIEAFIDVENAQQDRVKKIEQANAYYNEIIPQARGLANSMVQNAQAYSQQVVAKAEGEADRFLSILNEYSKAKDITKQRMYLETMETIYKGASKTIIDSEIKNVLPFLPINK